MRIAQSEFPMSRTAAILLAAGSGSRMQGAVNDKVLALLAGRPVVSHSASAFMQSATADDQARVGTPAAALDGGADLLVVGRPIVQAPDPVAAARALVAPLLDTP